MSSELLEKAKLTTRCKDSKDTHHMNNDHSQYLETYKLRGIHYSFLLFTIISTQYNYFQCLEKFSPVVVHNGTQYGQLLKE